MSAKTLFYNWPNGCAMKDGTVEGRETERERGDSDWERKTLFESDGLPASTFRGYLLFNEWYTAVIRSHFRFSQYFSFFDLFRTFLAQHPIHFELSFATIYWKPNWYFWLKDFTRRVYQRRLNSSWENIDIFFSNCKKKNSLAFGKFDFF